VIHLDRLGRQLKLAAAFSSGLALASLGRSERARSRLLAARSRLLPLQSACRGTAEQVAAGARVLSRHRDRR
jgi:hypothetical protein